MFQVTEAAAVQLAEARSDRGIPDSAGIRVFGEPQGGNQMALGLAFTEVPAEDDVVIQQHGTAVFIASEVAGPLDEITLDVEETSEGPKLVLTSAEPGGLL